MNQLISVILIFVSFYLYGCSGGQSALKNSILLAGASYALSDLSDVDRNDNGEAVIPSNRTYLRVKLQDDPLNVPEDHGLVHFILDYDEISHNVFVDGSGRKLKDLRFESITLWLDSVEAVKEDGTSVIKPADDLSITIFQENKRYARILNRLELPSGKYQQLIVHLQGGPGKKAEKPHTIKIESKEYPLNFIKKRLSYHDNFSVETGKLTTLNAKPTQPKVIHLLENLSQYRSQVELEATGYSVKWPVEKIWIHMKSISVTKDTGEKIVLSDTPDTFDLLELRDTAVLLVGNEMVPAGTYTHFTLELDPEHKIQVEGEEYSLTIVNEYTSNIIIPGPFELRGGRVSEIILDFNPNLSVHHTNESGYVLEPEIMVVSVLSMTPAQDLRFIQALGDYANPVAREAEVIFEGTVSELEYIVAKNKRGDQMIYTDMTMAVQDVLRGDDIKGTNSFSHRSIGGIYNDMLLKVNGMPVYKKGERFLLFLKKFNDVYAPVQGERGKIEL